jgi:hypothetical protein
MLLTEFFSQLLKRRLIVSEVSSIKKLAHSNAEWRMRIAEFKTKSSMAQSHKLRAPTYDEAPAGGQSSKKERNA